ncbi:MAG TPA: aminotransferase class IV [Bryobacteraceae bacterium]|jgi:branched-chain amino acid aminotransferase
MHPYLLHNDQIRPVDDRVIAPGQVGFLNGWGVFTTIRVYDGTMFAWDRHWARISRDARKIHVPIPDSPEWLEAQLYKLIEANHADEATLRVAIVRNKGGMFEGLAIEREFDVIAFTREVANWGDSVKLGIVPQARHAANEFAGVKFISWAQNLTWYEQAHERGFDEVVLLNERNEVSECTSANIFTVFGDHVFTPQLTSSGCLAGITRDVLLNNINIPGLEIAEHVLLPADLQSADEIFITSTTREILPVHSIEGLHIKTGRTITTQLAEAFTTFHRAYTATAKQNRTLQHH